VLWAVSSGVERLTAIRGFSGVSPQPPDLKVVFDTLIVGNVEHVVRLTALVAIAAALLRVDSDGSACEVADLSPINHAHLDLFLRHQLLLENHVHWYPPFDHPAY
jgi:hypothetical protein